MQADHTTPSNLYYRAKSSGKVYRIVEREDGTLFVTLDGVTSIPNAGLFIRNLGGIDTLKARCKRDTRSLEQINRSLEEKREATIRCTRQRRLEAEAAWASACEYARQRELKFGAATERELHELVARSEGGIIKATEDNTRTVARYLASHNPNCWKLPVMDVEYEARIHSNGAVTIDFDHRIEASGALIHRFVFGDDTVYINKLRGYTHTYF